MLEKFFAYVTIALTYLNPRFVVLKTSQGQGQVPGPIPAVQKIPRMRLHSFESKPFLTCRKRHNPPGVWNLKFPNFSIYSIIVCNKMCSKIPKQPILIKKTLRIETFHEGERFQIFHFSYTLYIAIDHSKKDGGSFTVTLCNRHLFCYGQL